MNTEKIGLFIKELRNEKKLTQKELAEELSITVQAVSKWERGKGLPDISYLEDLSKIFEVSILEILKGERSNEIQKEDILYSVEYGKETAKEKIFQVINNVIKVTVILTSVFLLIGNIINFYYGSKEYKNRYEESFLPEIKENYRMINTIKNDRGIFNDKDYEKILFYLNEMEEYLNIVEERIEDNNLSSEELKSSWYLGFELYSILHKYKNLNDEELIKYAKLLYYSNFENENFVKKIGETLYRYKLDNDTVYYVEQKSNSDNLIVVYTNIILKQIIEVGEING